MCSVADPVWRSGHEEAETNLVEGVERLSRTVGEESAETLDEVLSAIRVATRQESANGSREAEFQAAVMAAVAQVHMQVSAAEAVRAAHHTYGPMGQAVGGCEAVEWIARVTDALSSVPDGAAEILASGAIDVVPGSGVSPLEAAGMRLATDTPEAVSAVAFLDPDTVAEDRDAFMRNVIGLPPQLPESMASESDHLMMMEARRQQAIRSPAIVSLAAVRASHEAGEGELTSRRSLEEIVGRYGGGPEYEEWSAALVTKSETGLVKEIARLRSLSLALENARQGSGDRRQAVIGALLAAEVVE